MRHPFQAFQKSTTLFKKAKDYEGNNTVAQDSIKPNNCQGNGNMLINDRPTSTGLKRTKQLYRDLNVNL